MSSEEQTINHKCMALADWMEERRKDSADSFEDILKKAERRLISIGMGVSVRAHKLATDKTRYYPLLQGVGASVIIECVSSVYGVSVEALLGKRRTKHLVYPRHVAQWILRNRTDMSLKQVGLHFGKDHSSVLHGINRIEALRQQDPRMQKDLDAINKELNEISRRYRETAEAG